MLIEEYTIENTNVKFYDDFLYVYVHSKYCYLMFQILYKATIGIN